MIQNCNWTVFWLMILVNRCLLTRIPELIYTQHRNTAHIRKLFHSFKTPLPLLSCLNHRIKSVLLGHIAAARKVDGGRDPRVISSVTSSMTFLPFNISRWWRQTLNTGLYFTVISQSDYIFIYTRGQFWPSGIVVACVCLCVRPCAVITGLSAR